MPASCGFYVGLITIRVDGNGGRHFVTQSGSEGRYGFNGKEKDDDIQGQTVYDYGFRIYNPAIAKFLSVDPLTKEYPWYTP